MMGKRPKVLFLFGLLLTFGFGLFGGPAAKAQTVQIPVRTAATSLTPESLPGFLKEGNDKLAKEIAALQEDIEGGKHSLQQVAREQEELNTKIAALNASMALKELTAAQAGEEIEALQRRQAAISPQVKELEAKLENLSKRLQEKTGALEILQKEVAILRKAGHPVLRSQEMQKAYQTYQNLVKDFNQKGATLKEILEKTLSLRQTEQKLLTDTIARIQEDYLGKTLKEELLRRQTPRKRLEQLGQVLQTLAALPSKTYGWLRQALHSGMLTSLAEKNWPTLIGLLLFLLLLGLGASKFKALAQPELEAWQKQAPELGSVVLLSFARILVSHLFSLGFAAWLYICLWTLDLRESAAAWLAFQAIAALVVLRLLLKMIHSLFAGQTKGGLLPLTDSLARYLRRHLKALAIYFIGVGGFMLPNARHLGFTPEGAALLRHLFQVVLLGWACWLICRRPLDEALAQLPVPPFFQGKAFLRTARTAVFLALGFVVVSSLLGFGFLSDYIAQSASFILVVLALSWILGQGSYLILRLTLHPEVGVLVQKYPGQEKLLRWLYRLLTRTSILLGVAAALIVAFKMWGIAPDRLHWVFQWLARGPALGPVHLSPVNVGLTILVVYLGFWASRVMRTFLELKFYPRTDWDPGIRYTISTTLHYLILVIAVVIALNTLGISLTSLALVAGGLGVGMGFGLQNMVSNFASGITLLLERSIKVGDMLVIDGQWGTVREIRMRCTIFQTFDHSVLIIPNSELLSKTVLNWTYFGWGANRLTLQVGVSYDSDPRQVTQVVEAVCRANPRVLGDPPPQIFFQAYGDSSLNFTIWVHLGNPRDRIPATHELNTAILEAFRTHGIEVPFPQRDLHLRSWPAEAFPPLSPISTKDK